MIILPKEMAEKVEELPLGILRFIAFLLIVPSAIWTSFVFVELWEWFVVPVFSVITLTKAQAYGLVLFVSYIKYTPKSSLDSKKEACFKSIVLISSYFIFGVFVLSIGYFVKHFLI